MTVFVPDFTARLAGVTSGADAVAVHAARWGGWRAPNDGAEDLVARLRAAAAALDPDPATQAKTYPLAAPSELARTTTYFVYRLAASGPLEVDGFPILQILQYVVSVRTPEGDVEPLIDATAAVQSQFVLADVAYASSVAGMAQELEVDPRVYRADLDVDVAYLAVDDTLADGQALPAAFVYPLQTRASAPRFDNDNRQHVDYEYGVVSVSKGDAFEVSDALRQRLMGWQPSPTATSLELLDGRAVAIPEGAGLSLWRDVYTLGETVRAN